jgi:hypothetical protein
VADTPVGCGGRPKSAAQVGPSAGVHCDLPCNRLPFVGHYRELHHTGLQYGLVQRLTAHGTF